MKLSNINVSMTTNVLEKVSVSAGMTLDPYAVDYRGRRYNQFNVVQTGRLARLTNANVLTKFQSVRRGVPAKAMTEPAAVSTGAAEETEVVLLQECLTAAVEEA